MYFSNKNNNNYYAKSKSPLIPIASNKYIIKFK